MDFRLRTNARHFSNDELLADLRRVAKIYGKDALAQREYGLKGNFAHKNFYKRFGSWNNALKKAGLKITVSKTVTNEELFDNLELIWRQLGRQPFYTEIRKPASKFAVDTYCRKFGSWFKACESFIRYKKQDPEFIRLFKQESITRSKRTITEKVRLQIFKRDHYSCRKCGKSPSSHRGITLHLDHVVPFSKGGDNSSGNLQTLCNKCNLGKGNDENL